ncbi:hypothetical protein TNCV_2205131 [Trichonephila clavipes]|nr:hypothetical protein TNCV_2205131 [Trichonephila clavipes]
MPRPLPFFGIFSCRLPSLFAIHSEQKRPLAVARHQSVEYLKSPVDTPPRHLERSVNPMEFLSVRFTICKHIHYVCQKFPFMVANVSDETVLLVDEDSNRLRREKEKEAILKEMEKSVVHEEPTELVYE